MLYLVKTQFENRLRKWFKQAGAELCQAQVKLEGIVDVVEEAWS